MSDAAIYYNETITQLSDYAVYAEARLGSNGDPWGEAEIATGTSPDDAQFSRTIWDANLEDGFDSGGICAAFTTELDDEIQQLSAANQFSEESTTISTSFSGAIEKVQLRAMTLAAAMVAWSNVSIAFYRDGTLVETYANASGISVDERNETGPVEAEALLEVTPEATDYDQVVITATFQMTYDSTTITPGATDLAGQFFVYCA